MGLLSGPIACTRFNIVSIPEEPDFEKLRFTGIQPGSSLREKEGFLSYEPEEPYEIGSKKWAFRVRMDKVQADLAQLKERWKELIKLEEDEVGPPSPRKKKQLRQLAEDELLSRTPPRTKLVECLIDNTILYVGTTSKSQIGTVLALLKNIGVEVEYKTPWLDAGQEEEPHEYVELREPGQSIYGCKFLKDLLNDPAVLLESMTGNAKLVTPARTKVTLSARVLNELGRYLDEGAAILSAKLHLNDLSFSFDGLSYRISGLKVDTPKGAHWTEALSERIAVVRDLFAELDAKYMTLFENDAQSAAPSPEGQAGVLSDELTRVPLVDPPGGRQPINSSRAAP